MAIALTCLAIAAAIPAVVDTDDFRALLLGINAMIWAGAGMAVA